MWNYNGSRRPDFAEPPGPGQESVWDYPRPPRIEPERRTVRVVSPDGREVASSRRALRVLETASPPTVYLSREDLRYSNAGSFSEPISEFIVELDPRSHSSFCEWKGRAHYIALGPFSHGSTEASAEPVGWFYPEPAQAFESIRGFIAFYPARVACFLDDERVRSQPGGFYGGWITDELVGPWKGDPGSRAW